MFQSTTIFRVKPQCAVFLNDRSEKDAIEHPVNLRNVRVRHLRHLQNEPGFQLAAADTLDTVVPLLQALVVGAGGYRGIVVRIAQGIGKILVQSTPAEKIDAAFGFVEQCSGKRRRESFSQMLDRSCAWSSPLNRVDSVI